MCSSQNDVNCRPDSSGWVFSTGRFCMIQKLGSGFGHTLSLLEKFIFGLFCVFVFLRSQTWAFSDKRAWNFILERIIIFWKGISPKWIFLTNFSSFRTESHRNWVHRSFYVEKTQPILMTQGVLVHFCVGNWGNKIVYVNWNVPEVSATLCLSTVSTGRTPRRKLCNRNCGLRDSIVHFAHPTLDFTGSNELLNSSFWF